MDFEIGVRDIYLDQDGGSAGGTGASSAAAGTTGVTTVASGGTGIPPGTGGNIPSYKARKKKKRLPANYTFSR